jgi:hypothetical protein
VSVLSFIEEAFGQRPRPAEVVEDVLPRTELYADALAFGDLEWHMLTCSFLEQYHDAVFGFSPAAFCYFLPGIFSAGIKEARPDLLVNRSLIATLDRGNSPASWDEFFIKRWPTLSRVECEATQRWILWMEDFEPLPIEDLSLSRAYDTLQLLSTQKAATPLAGHSRK